MRIDLSNKTAVVTGSTAGIGFAIAQGLAAAGATTVINGRTQGAIDKAIAALKRAIPSAAVRGVAADLSTAQGCEALVEAESTADILARPRQAGRRHCGHGQCGAARPDAVERCRGDAEAYGR
jgi:NAD(P)-dependent dehydrogenase (short-subunit alcohol dehydrogenase family)